MMSSRGHATAIVYEAQTGDRLAVAVQESDEPEPVAIHRWLANGRLLPARPGNLPPASDGSAKLPGL